MKTTRIRIAVAALVAVIVTSIAAGVGSARSQAQITVLAAASLTNVFPLIDSTPKYSFGGSDLLAAQIRLGAPAHVFAAANTTLPTQLYNAGLVEKPVVFTANRLVLVVPKTNPAGIKTVFDLRKSGVKLLVGTPAVPVGSYTRTILKRLGISTAVLANVVSQETDVRSILGKVALGEADAGFVYITDANTVKGQVTVISLPGWAQPPVRYGIAVIKNTGNRADAVAFINKVLSAAGQSRLKAAGFGAVRNITTSYVGG